MNQREQKIMNPKILSQTTYQKLLTDIAVVYDGAMKDLGVAVMIS